MENEPATGIAVLLGQADVGAFIDSVGLTLIVVVLVQVIKGATGLAGRWVQSLVLGVAIGLSLGIAAAFGTLTPVTPIAGLGLGVLSIIFYDSLARRMNGDGA